ncbi:MAG: DNA/RNA non-specific endonuclease [Clostridiales bacterium]|nr:DNA/RNA non-specific endonuclease [Clostridiales bacterium]
MYINGINIPEYFGKPCIKIANNLPDFSENFQGEKYKKLGSYERCGEEYTIYSAFACIKGEDLSVDMSRLDESNGVSEIYPDKYDFIKGDKYLFNYCHLIAYQLLKEKTDKRNLIVGTRYMNEKGMLPLENKVRKYLEENPRNQVLYRVTPILNEGDQLVRGVQMEAYSVEDNGKGLCFNKFIYNAQPGVAINYKEGKSEEDKDWCVNIFPNIIYRDKRRAYILNIATHKFHKKDCNESICNEAKNIEEYNKREIECPRKFLKDNGYKPCGNCKP